MEHGINSRTLVTAATSISTRTEMISADTNATTAATNRIGQEVLEIKRKLERLSTAFRKAEGRHTERGVVLNNCLSAVRCLAPSADPIAIPTSFANPARSSASFTLSPSVLSVSYTMSSAAVDPSIAPWKAFQALLPSRPR
jgi:hypothetical protein